MEAIKEIKENKTTQQLFSKEDLKKLIVPLLFEQALAITVGMADTVMISSAETAESTVQQPGVREEWAGLIFRLPNMAARCREQLM